MAAAPPRKRYNDRMAAKSGGRVMGLQRFENSEALCAARKQSRLFAFKGWPQKPHLRAHQLPRIIILSAQSTALALLGLLNAATRATPEIREDFQSRCVQSRVPAQCCDHSRLTATGSRKPSLRTRCLFKQRGAPIRARALSAIARWAQRSRPLGVRSVPAARAVENLPQRPFALTVANFHRHRQPPSDSGDAMVEQRNAGFETDRHRRAIDLRQYVVRKVGDAVEQHHAGTASSISCLSVIVSSAKGRRHAPSAGVSPGLHPRRSPYRDRRRPASGRSSVRFCKPYWQIASSAVQSLASAPRLSMPSSA